MFKIKVEEGDLNLSVKELTSILIQKAYTDHSNQKLCGVNDFVEHINVILQKDFLDSTPRSMASIYFLAGYYYKIFLEKNNVEIKKENEHV